MLAKSSCLGVGAVLSVLMCDRLKTRFSRRKRENELEELASKKRDERNSKEHPLLMKAISQRGQHLKDLEAKIAGATATELREMMAQKKVTCEDVVLIFCHRAFTLGSWRSGPESLNCVAEENYDEALELARKIDRESTDSDWADASRLPLLGIPVSVKDQLIQKGFDATMGSAVRCFQWGPNGAPDDGVSIKLLKEAGAVPFTRTNTQQSLMLPESTNNVWGTSRNPYDFKRTPGGSSGGEGGLVGARCSPVGIGTDIGGSVRIPAHFCGLYGLKPTTGRITALGVSVARKGDRNGQTIIKGTQGPLAHCVEDLAAVMRAWTRPSCWDHDPTLPRMPFDEKMYSGVQKRRLRVAYFVSDGWFDPCPTGVRAVTESAAALKKAGHDVVEVKLPSNIDGWMAARLYFAIMAADGNMYSMVEGLEGERLHEMYNQLKAIADLPNMLRPVIRMILGMAGEMRKRYLFSTTRSGGVSARDFWAAVADVEAFRKDYVRFMQDGGYDILLLAGPALPALLHGKSSELHQTCCYTFLLNLLGWPAGICPITCVQDSEQCYPSESLPPCQRDKLAKLADQSMRSSAGLPVGVQLAALPFQDELVLYAMRELEKAIPFKPPPISSAL